MGTDGEFVEVATVEEVRDEGQKLVNTHGRAILLVAHEGEIHAVDDRCPHMGFPLHRGTVDDGILTCHWHHARFELSCGDTFDPFADDVDTFPVEVRDGAVWVDPVPPRDQPPAEHWMERLEDGLEENLRLVVAKSVVGLDEAGVDPADPLALGVAFGTRNRDDGWGAGLTVHAAMANVLDQVGPEDRRRALYQGLLEVASDASGQPPKFDQPAFSTTDVPPARLKDWFRDCVEVRDDDGAERCLRTALAEDLSEAQLAELLFAAATDHLYLDAGHTLDFVNKAFEVLEHVGWEHADRVLPSVIPRLTGATRSEELAAWRQPVDLAGMAFDVHDRLPELVEAGAGKRWTRPADFVETLLSDDPEAIVEAVTGAIRDGASTEQLAAAVAEAAGTRVAQFSTGNEFGDWNTVHHTFTYANAVHRASRRTPATELYRGALAGAMSVYLDRFLNTPPARIPEPSTPDADPAALLESLVETFDAEGEVDAAGRLTAEFLDAGGDPDELKAALGHALLREDANFHTLQALEAGFSQSEATDDPTARRTFLVAVARYMAAHFPTRREREQTFIIAERLNRGEKLHEAAD